jgi:hypothetical protein
MDVVVVGFVVVVLVDVEVEVDVDVLVVDVVLVDVVVTVTVVVEVLDVDVTVVLAVELLVDVPDGASGRMIDKKTWSGVDPLLFVETRIWHVRQSSSPLIGFSGGWFGDKQLKTVCGLSPLNGVKRFSGFGSVGDHVTVPLASGTSGVGDDPRSQSTVAPQVESLTGFPSHCSTYTSLLGSKPVADTVIATGLPVASPGTWNGPGGAGCVIEVVANARPVVNTSSAMTPTTTRLDTRRIRSMGPPPRRERFSPGD